MKLEFTILGIPSAKQSVKSAVRYNKAGNTFVQHYQPKEVIEACNNIKLQAIDQLPVDFAPIDKNLAVTKLHYIFPIPKSFSNKQIEAINNGVVIYKGTKPDITDNLNKGLFDALQGIVYINDSLICTMDDVKKYYGIVPKTILVLETL